MRIYLFALLLVTIPSSVFGQGCSDAGICSVNKGFVNDSIPYRNSIEVSSIYGVGEADVQYLSHYLSYTKRFNNNFSFTGKVTLSTATGSFGTRTQFGDAFTIGNYDFNPVNKKQWSVLGGFKFPFTASNLKINGYSLPLDYQSSLGTIDAFAGTNFRYSNWDFNAIIQIPIINLNKNSYFAEYSGTGDFQSTNLFERAPDALFRSVYTIRTANNKFAFKPSILLIYHLGEDSFVNIFGERETIDGSDGLTLNGNFLSSYQFNKTSTIELSVAAPFVVRDARPDGLTRSFVFGIQYRKAF